MAVLTSSTSSALVYRESNAGAETDNDASQKQRVRRWRERNRIYHARVVFNGRTGSPE